MLLAQSKYVDYVQVEEDEIDFIGVTAILGEGCSCFPVTGDTETRNTGVLGVVAYFHVRNFISKFFLNGRNVPSVPQSSLVT